MKNNRILRIVILVVLMAIIVVIAFLMGKRSKPISRDGYYFDTYVNLTVYNQKDAKYLDECLQMCEKYEKLFSRTLEGSDIWNVNNAGGEAVSVDPETYYLIEKALEFCEETDGAVDLTVAPLVDAWGFNHNDEVRANKPSDEEINEALGKVNYENVILLDNNMIKLEGKGTKMDLGFIAKGYIADKLKEYLVSKNVKSAIISLGGNIVVICNKPDGSEYNIGIKDPDNSGDIIQSLKVSDKSVVTSGTYERYVEYDGVKYHHILDTKTGYPVDNGVQSVTIVSDSSLEGDALSTICLILGEEGAKEILNKYNSEAYFY